MSRCPAPPPAAGSPRRPSGSSPCSCSATRRARDAGGRPRRRADRRRPLAGFAVVELIAARQPRNAVGWLLLLIRVQLRVRCPAPPRRPTSAPTSFHAARGRRRLRCRAGSTWIWITTAGVFLPLVFPHGTLLSARWRWVLRLGLLALALSCSPARRSSAARSISDGVPRGIENPLQRSGAPPATSVDVLLPGGVRAAEPPRSRSAPPP